MSLYLQSLWFSAYHVVEITIISSSSGKSKKESKKTNNHEEDFLFLFLFSLMWSIYTSQYHIYSGSFSWYCFNESKAYESAGNWRLASKLQNMPPSPHCFICLTQPFSSIFFLEPPESQISSSSWSLPTEIPWSSLSSPPIVQIWFPLPQYIATSLQLSKFKCLSPNNSKLFFLFLLLGKGNVLSRSWSV